MYKYTSFGASLVALLIKNLPAVQETPVLFLGWEDPLEVGMATHPRFLPGESHDRIWWAIVHSVTKCWIQPKELSTQA